MMPAAHSSARRVGSLRLWVCFGIGQTPMPRCAVAEPLKNRYAKIALPGTSYIRDFPAASAQAWGGFLLGGFLGLACLPTAKIA
jgi:hypothetical protein